MQKKLNVLSIVCAKSNSTRIPGKNLKVFADKPLIEWSMIALSKCKSPMDCVISSDSEEILDLGRKYLFDTIKRPKELCRDGVEVPQVIMHAIREMEKRTGKTYDLILSKQGTFPLVKPKTIDRILGIAMKNEQADSVQPMVAVRGYFAIGTPDSMVPLTWQTSGPQCGYLNGKMIYNQADPTVSWRRCWKANELVLDYSNFVYPVVDDEEGIDIDTMKDWYTALYYANKMSEFCPGLGV